MTMPNQVDPRKRAHRLPLLFAKALLLLFILLGTAAAAPSEAGEEAVYKRYSIAMAGYNNFLKAEKLKQDRNQWLARIEAFHEIYRRHPNHETAPRCLFMIGRIFRQLYHISNNPMDLGEALANFEDVAALFPETTLADDALYNVGDINLIEKKDSKTALVAFTKIAKSYPDGDMLVHAQSRIVELSGAPPQPQDEIAAPEKPAEKTAAAPPAKAKVLDLRHGSTNYYSRIIVELSEPVQYEDNILEQTTDQPRRLYVNLWPCKIPKRLTSTIPIDDGLLKQVRSAQYTNDTVRIVLDTQSISSHKISTMENPYRVVIDVWGKGEPEGEIVEAKPQPQPRQPENIPHSLPQQLGLMARRIIIDPGHGGKDPGAVGPGGMMEKDITLKVAKLVADRLQNNHSYEVVLTRDRDHFLSLEKRTEIANTARGDIFLSLHVNSAENPRLKGIETYFLSLATNKDEMRAAAKENATSNRQLSDLQAILMDLLHNTKVNESAKLAERIQGQMVSGLAPKYGGIQNLGVKKAPFIVLIGAQMPAALVEIAFLSNPDELKRLRDDAFLADVADQITSGISSYVDDLNRYASSAR